MPTFQRRINVILTLFENETKSDVEFSTLHNVDTKSLPEVETTLKQRWYNLISTLFQLSLNDSKSYIETNRASDKNGFVNRWWWWIVLVVWLTDERCLALFPDGNIVRDPHHRSSPAVITTTPRRHHFYSAKYFL